MRLYLVHHAEALGPHVDPQRPLSARGHLQAEHLAAHAKAAGIVPVAIWHSGKLRARQTADALYRVCNPFAEFTMIRGLLPDDSPQHIRDRLSGETRDILLAGHMPNLREILETLVPGSATFPLHGLVALERRDAGWTEVWRIAATDS